MKNFYKKHLFAFSIIGLIVAAALIFALDTTVQNSKDVMDFLFGGDLLAVLVTMFALFIYLMIICAMFIPALTYLAENGREDFGMIITLIIIGADRVFKKDIQKRKESKKWDL